MRRAFRSTVTVASALSLLLCVTAAVLWVRSYFVSSCVPRLVEPNEVQVHSAAGRLIVLSTQQANAKAGQFFNAHTLLVGERRVPLDGIDKSEWQQLVEERWPVRSREMVLTTHAAKPGNLFGFDVQLWRQQGPWYLVIPYWSVVAALAAMPLTRLALAVVRRRRAARAAANSDAEGIRDSDRQDAARPGA